MFFSRIKSRIKKIKTSRQFAKESKASPDTVFLLSAACSNTGAAENFKIESHCTIGAYFIIKFGGKVFIDQNTYIGPGTIIQCKESITIGKGVIIANNVLIIDNNNHPVEPELRWRMSLCNDFLNDELWTWKYAQSKPIVIEDNVWIGRDCRIMKGVTIGKGSIVALGSIVTKDVPPYSMVAGNPARIVKSIKPMEDLI